MTNRKSSSLIPPHIMAELQAAADRAAQGVRDPETMLKAYERMDSLREEIRRQHGTLDIGVAAIRELRDGE
ncbi:MAG TPA: hypothetical protein VGX70_13395 [Gemmataceae bacterium]|jgi:hypothetical protein|nr:hypothetical protein [Gemmataceae bacterium]